MESFTGDYYGRIAKRCTVTRARSTVEYIIFLNHGYIHGRGWRTERHMHMHTHSRARAVYVLISRTSRTYICTSVRIVHREAYTARVCIEREHKHARAITRSLATCTHAACKCRITRSLRTGRQERGRRRRGV